MMNPRRSTARGFRSVHRRDGESYYENRDEFGYKDVELVIE